MRSLACVALFFLAPWVIAPAAAQNTVWTHVVADSVVTGSWTEASNWNNGVPANSGAYSNALLANTVNSYAVNVDSMPPAFAQLIMTNAPGQTVTLNVYTNMDGSTAHLATLREAVINVHTNGKMNFVMGDHVYNTRMTVKNGGLLLWEQSSSYRQFYGVSIVIESGGIVTNIDTAHFLYLANGSRVLVEAGAKWHYKANDIDFSSSSIAPTILTNRGTIIIDRMNGRLSVGTLTYTMPASEIVMESGSLSRLGAYSQADGIEIGTVPSASGNTSKGRFTLRGGVVTNQQDLKIGKSGDIGTGGARIGRDYAGEGELLIYGGEWQQTGNGIVQIGGWEFGAMPNVPTNGIMANAYNTVKGYLTQTAGVFRTPGDVRVGNGPSQGTITLSGGAFYATNTAGTSTLQLSLQTEPNFVVPVGPGIATLNLQGGRLTVDRFIATNGATYLTNNFQSGTLEIKRYADIKAGVPLLAGDGVAAACLILGDTSTNRFNDGLVLNTNATLIVSGTNTIGSARIEGNLTLRPDARLAWDFNATTQDWAVITGTVTLPSSAVVDLTRLDTSMPQTIPLLSATGGFQGNSPATWPMSVVDGKKYKAMIDGTTLRMERYFPPGTMIMMR
jgi:hypothetical protein